jgi:hypothetical protein
MPHPVDLKIVQVLRERDGRWTRIELMGGGSYRAVNIAWGYDIGDEWAHVTTNISPPRKGASISFFHTSDVLRLVDEESGSILFEASPQ